MVRYKQYLFSVVVMAVWLSMVGSGQASISSTNFSIPGNVVSAGTGSAASTGYKLQSTIGQAGPVGYSSSTSFSHGAGFWYMPAEPVVDTDGDGLTDVQEAALGINPDNPDTDGDGFGDGKEVALGTDPKLASSVPYSVGAVVVTRSDSGNAADNLSSGNPKVDLSYTFTATVKDLSGTPQYVKLLTAQRTSPAATDYYGYTMSCTGSFSAGAACSFTTRLGPAAVHKYSIEAKTADGTILSGTQAVGPRIQLLNGYTMAGLSRDLSGSSLDGAAAFESASTYRWVSSGVTTDSNKGQYELIDTAKPAKSGEGYFVKRISSAALPELGSYGNLTTGTHAITLAPGWNMISNPYVGAVKLSTVQVKQGSSAPVSWSSAAASGWVINAIYYFKGSDWGGTYGFESAGGAPDAVLTPWLGYWVYVKKSDAAYSVVITKP